MTDIGGRGSGGGGRPPSKADAADLNNILQQQLAIMNDLKAAMSSMTEEMTRFCETSKQCFSNNDWQKVTKDVQKHNKQTTTATESTSKLAKQVSSLTSTFQKLAPVMGGLVGFTKGLGQGFRNLFALTKGAFNFGKTLVKSLKDITMSILMVPFKMLKGLIDMASQGGDTSLAQALEDIREEFGTIGTTAKSVKTAAFEMKGFNATGLSAYQVFENAADRVKFFGEMAKGLGSSVHLFSAELANNGGALAAYQKGLGLTGEDMGALGRVALRTGKTLSSTANDVTKFSINMAKSFGLNAKAVSKDMVKAMGDMKNFGHLSTKELATSVVYANKLGISIDKLTGLMDQFDTFDKSAEAVSGLNSQFGTNIDAMELMSAQSPGEKFELLRKSFAATGKDLKSLNFAEKKYLQTTAGLTDEAYNAMVANQDQGDMMKDVAKEADKTEKKTLSQAEAMSELATQIKRVVRSDEGSGGFLSRLFQGFAAGIKTSGPFREMMMKIRQSLLIVMGMGKKLGAIFANLPFVSGVFKAIGNMFDPARFQRLSAGITGIFKKYFGANGEFIGNSKDMLKEVMKVFSNFFMGGAGGASKLGENVGKFGKFIVKILAGALSAIIDILPGIITKIADWIKNPVFPKTGAVDKAWYQPLWDVIKTIPEKLGPALKDLALAIWGKVKEGLTSNAGKGILMGAVGVALAPALLGGLTGAGAGGMMSGAIGKFKGLFGAKTAAVADAAGGVGKAATAAGGDAAAAANAGKTIEGATPKPALIQGFEAIGESNISFTKLIKFFLAFAGFLAIGLKAFAEALEIVKNYDIVDIVKAGLAIAAIGITFEKMAPAIAAMSAPFWTTVSWTAVAQSVIAAGGFLAVGLLAFAAALVLVGDVPIKKVLTAGAALVIIGFVMGLMAPLLGEAALVGMLANKYGKELAIGMVAMGLAVIAIAGVAWIAIKWLGDFSLGEISKTIIVMTAFTALFIASGLIVAEAGAIGAAVILSGGVGAGAIAIGLVAMGLAVIEIAAVAALVITILGGFALSKIIKTGIIMAGMTVLFHEAAEIIAKAGAIGTAIIASFGIGAVAILIGMTALRLGIEVMADVAIDLISRLGKISLIQAITAGLIMVGTGALFAAVGLLLTEAGAIGVTIIASFGLGAAAIYLGMKALQFGVDAIADTAISIIERLASIKEEPAAMKMKAKAFSSIVMAIAKMMDSLAGILEEMDFGFWESSSDMARRVGAVQDFVEVLIRGDAGDGGIIGIIDSIMGGLKSVSKEQLEASQAFAGILGALAKLMEVMTGPAIELQSKTSHWYQSAEEDATAAATAIRQLQNYIKLIAQQTTLLVKTVMDMLKELTPADMQLLKDGGQALGSILGAVGQLMSAMKPGSITTGNVTNQGTGDVNQVVNVTIPTMRDQLLAVKDVLPGLVKALITTIESVPSGEEFLAKIESAKKLFEAIKPLSSAIKTLTDAGKEKEDVKSESIKAKLQKFEAFFYNLVEGPGTFAGVLFQMERALGSVGDGAKYEKLSQGAANSFSAIEAITKKIADLENADIPDSKNIKDSLRKFESLFFIAASYIPSMAGNIVSMGESLQSNSEKLSMTKDQFIIFNDAIKQISSAMQTLANSRDTFVNGAQSSEIIANQLSILPATMSHMESQMTLMRFEGDKSVVKALRAVEDMVYSVQRLDNALAQLPNIDIPARLTEVAKGMGIGAGGAYTVKSKDVIINVSFTVSMETEKIERAILADGAVIRAALNFASGHAGEAGEPAEPAEASPAWYTNRDDYKISTAGDWANGTGPTFPE